MIYYKVQLGEIAGKLYISGSNNSARKRHRRPYKQDNITLPCIHKTRKPVFNLLVSAKNLASFINACFVGQPIRILKGGLVKRSNPQKWDEKRV